MKVSGLLHALAALTTGQEPCTHEVGYIAGLIALKVKICLLRGIELGV
jgi:hypothetical protein